MKSTPRKTQLGRGFRVARPSGSYLHIRKTVVIIYHCLKMHIPFLYIIVGALTYNFVLIKKVKKKKLLGVHIFNDVLKKAILLNMCLLLEYLQAKTLFSGRNDKAILRHDVLTMLRRSDFITLWQFIIMFTKEHV